MVIGSVGVVIGRVGTGVLTSCTYRFHQHTILLLLVCQLLLGEHAFKVAIIRHGLWLDHGLWLYSLPTRLNEGSYAAVGAYLVTIEVHRARFILKISHRPDSSWVISSYRSPISFLVEYLSRREVTRTEICWFRWALRFHHRRRILLATLELRVVELVG